MTGRAEIGKEIRRLADERDAVVLAHNYQRPEVQGVADFVGDSLGLSRQAASSVRSAIVFAGVHFMAETAKILSPDKTVVLAEPAAGCPMADMITAKELAEWKARFPGVPVVTYVNSSAEVKALSDFCCTSANAVEVVRSLGVPRVLFCPDRNLASWVASKLLDVEVIAWQGFCPIHEEVTSEQVREVMAAHPRAEVLAHPECRPEVLDLADAVLSTSQMLMHAATSSATEFVVVTERELVHQLRQVAPEKEFYPMSCMLCPNMKLTTLEKVRNALRTLSPPVEVPEDVRRGALAAVERMVAIG